MIRANVALRRAQRGKGSNAGPAVSDCTTAESGGWDIKLHKTVTSHRNKFSLKIGAVLCWGTLLRKSLLFLNSSDFFNAEPNLIYILLSEDKSMKGCSKQNEWDSLMLILKPEFSVSQKSHFIGQQPLCNYSKKSLVAWWLNWILLHSVTNCK